MTNTTNNTILVIGSTGKSGTRDTYQLEKRGIVVRHRSRSADIPFDWDRRACHTFPSPRLMSLGAPSWRPGFALNFNEGAWLIEGREPKDFNDYARETVATGVWTV
jgi:hypothetical protein